MKAVAPFPKTMGASDEKLIFLSVLRFQERRQPRYLGYHSRSIPAWSGRATAARLGGGFLVCVDKSRSLWSFASNASRTRNDPDPVHPPSAQESGRTAWFLGGVSRAPCWGKRKSSDFNEACLIQACKASRVTAVISNWTGRLVLCMHDDGSRGQLVTMGHVTDLECNEIATRAACCQCRD